MEGKGYSYSIHPVLGIVLSCGSLSFSVGFPRSEGDI